MSIWRGCAWSADLLEVRVSAGGFVRFNLDVHDLGVRRTFTAENAEFDEVVPFAFSFDVDAAFVVVVFHKALDVMLYGIAVHVAPEPDVEDTAVDADGVSFHAAKIAFFIFFDRAVAVNGFCCIFAAEITVHIPNFSYEVM